MVRHIQKRGDALDLIKHDSPVLALGGFDLAQERRRLGEVLLMHGWMNQVQEKNFLIREGLAQERAFSGQPGAEEKEAVALGQI